MIVDFTVGWSFGEQQAIAASSSERKTYSTKYMPLSPTAPRANWSNAWLVWTS
jgi:hypothetical protein